LKGPCSRIGQGFAKEKKEALLEPKASGIREVGFDRKRLLGGGLDQLFLY